MKILLGDFNAKVGRENIFKTTVEIDSLYRYSKDNVVRVLNFTTSESLVVKSRMFTHRNFQKYT
jgi:hypothetical protein